jgi:two-component system cell cycle response regulator DivK
MSDSNVVLIVEDNAQNMMMMRDLLQVQGYEVLQACNGQQGWDLAREHRPDLILMDIQLPDVSGLEVTKWLKADENLKSVPVIAVTAFAMKGDRELMLRMGCDGYVSKPISVPDFLRILEYYFAPDPAGAAGRTLPACFKQLSSPQFE